MKRILPAIIGIGFTKDINYAIILSTPIQKENKLYVSKTSY
jgi:hypothetical protein